MEQVPLWVSFTQIGASIFLGVAALLVAGLSFYWSYRNNFGWKPGMIVMESGLGVELANPKHRSVSFKPQVWNRRRYPITIVHCQLKLSDLRVDTELPIEMPRLKDGYYIQVPDELHADLNTNLAPNTSMEAPIRFYYKADPPFDPPGSYTLTFRYYDPRAHKVLEISETKKFKMTTKFPVS